VEWLQSRLGVITASEADALVTSKGKVKEGGAVDTYLYRKLAEKLTGYCPEMFDSYEMDQGRMMETTAIPFYEFTTGRKVERVGFITTDDGAAGCSPDGMLENGSGLEIKCPQAPNHIKYLLGGVVPDEYVVQVQMSIWVTHAPYWTFLSYSRKLPALIVRADPDPKIQAAISEAVGTFTQRMSAAVAAITSK